MPLALDPNLTTEIVLPSDEHRPEESRPAFIVRFLTCRELTKFYATFDAARADKELPGEMAKLDAAIFTALVGWRNIIGRDGAPIDFAADRLDDVLTLGEKWRLARLIPSAVSISEQEKKASASSSQDDGEASVPNAAAGNAPTSPAPPSP